MPKIVDREEMRREMARASMAVMARGGMAATTIKEIARATGSSPGLPLHYFDSRDDLIRFAFEWLADDLWRDLHAAVEGAAPGAERVRTLLTRLAALADSSDQTVAFLQFVCHGISD